MIGWKVTGTVCDERVRYSDIGDGAAGMGLRVKRLIHSLRFVLMVAGALAFQTPASAQSISRDIPSWLQQHVGTGEGQIAPVVLERARDLYQQQWRRAGVRNPCYMAMDATRPSTSSNGTPTQRYYIVCEEQGSFTAVSSGYGNGRSIPGADFSNGRECARHFSNALGSNLTMGGAYLTAEARTSHKGYIRQNGQTVPFNRTFLVFDGMRETSNARERAIGGHMAAFVRSQCRMSVPSSPHADESGFIRFGRLIDYTSGRSNGCTTWSEDVSQQIISLVDGNRTSLYIYPESRDIDAVGTAVSNGRSLSEQGLYWNSSCLNQIGAPRFWPRRQLEPIIREWRASLPTPSYSPLPICQ
ncbi:murein L,D-transpeptidase catalytic domain family protein [Octadecabacter sp. CECT 8868]|uniref:murein L,D-transpeptidase catalytic domain-containing protein n=1 Tax=Octadecabacter algicola TaxID=2909342 RepID=UPI001F2EDF49|nr:murein L,D-transpeptidase catalytic domain family protein [Octadecabacter algicola]MCF2904968.1 murein L,D-transpeptidase catalytic domain family protein [Octadecabacter algicola]